MKFIRNIWLIYILKKKMTDIDITNPKKCLRDLIKKGFKNQCCWLSTSLTKEIVFFWEIRLFQVMQQNGFLLSVIVSKSLFYMKSFASSLYWWCCCLLSKINSIRWWWWECLRGFIIRPLYHFILQCRSCSVVFTDQMYWHP